MKNINWDKVKELSKNPKAKAIAFFGFYFVFFLTIAILARISPSKPKQPVKQPKKTNYYNLGKITDANYHFKYLYEINGNITTYEGDRNGVRQIFAMTTIPNVNNYYGFKNLFKKNENGVWTKADNPYVYPKLLEVDTIKEVLDNATFISKTEYQDNRKTYVYQISTSTLENIIEHNMVDLDDIPNEVDLIMDEKYYVEGIQYKLNSYATFKDPNIKEATINLEYSDFGNIKEIEEPE